MGPGISVSMCGAFNVILEAIPRPAIPAGAHIVVENGKKLTAGTLIAKTPRKVAKTKDITGGLPRVVELFEARTPRDPAVISEIDGLVKDGGVVKGQRKMIIIPDDAGEPREYALPRGVHVNVHEGERVRAGEQLMDGPSNPHDMAGSPARLRAGVPSCGCWGRRNCRSTW